jgi:hypothetical protein
MAATYVTVAELRANLGIGTLYSDVTVEEVCSTAEDLVNSFLWFNRVPVVAAALTTNIATLAIASQGQFVIGQSVVIANSGATYNGTRTITGVGPYWPVTAIPVAPMPFTYPRGYSYLQFAITASDDPYHLIQPYGSMTGPDTKSLAYASTPAVREASMMLAVDIWQARQVSQTGGVSVDGFTPSPWRMGNSLMSKVRGLLANYSSPNAMVG